MNKPLLITGGILNALLTLFHICLGREIQSYPDLSFDARAIMHMLNVGVIMILAFAACASFFCREELVSTPLGRMTLILIVIFYIVRALEEVILAPDFSAAIFGVCLLVALDYILVMYTAACSWQLQKVRE